VPEITLTCASAEDARIVALNADRPGDPDHRCRQDGARVIVTYHDKRYPLDVADYAFQAGHASDAEAANTIALL
jgi:hypothetical protein